MRKLIQITLTKDILDANFKQSDGNNDITLKDNGEEMISEYTPSPVKDEENMV